MEIKRAKFQYEYKARTQIEECTSNKFNIYTVTNTKELTQYIEYGENIYNVNFNSEINNAIIGEWISREKFNKFIENTEVISYECEEIIKVYTGFKLNTFNYVKRNSIVIQNTCGGIHYNPTIIYDNDTAIIKSGDKVISIVRDIRNITLLKSINKKKDFVYVNDNCIYIYSLKLIDREDEELKITIYEDDKDIKRCIRYGSSIDDNIWLFFIENKSSDIAGEMLLKLPNGKYYNCLLCGNELKIKNIDKRKKLNGIAYALVRNKKKVTISNKSGEDNIIDERDGFNEITSEFSNNNTFLKLMNEYMDVEADILESAKKECKTLRYISLEKDKFIIHEQSREFLEPWSRKIGVTVDSEKSTLGTLEDVGEDYIKVNFTDEMTRNSISKKSGKLDISLFGDEIIQNRRKRAISILENGSSANCNLAEILSGEYLFNEYKLNNTIPKWNVGNLIPKQLEAIEGVLNSPDIYLIQGPPGTGKTTVIRRIVNEIIEKNQQVLVTSYQNLAVDNILDGFLKENIIPFRFGSEDNYIMNKICDEIVTEINDSIKTNISLEKDKEFQKIKERIEKLSHIIFEKEGEELKELCVEALDIVEAYEGTSSNYLTISDIIKKLNDELSEDKLSFDRNKVMEMLPETYGFDMEVSERLEATQDYLVKVNEKIQSITIDNIIEQIKNLQDIDVVFSLEDRDYQKIKHKIFDELKIVKADSLNDIDYFYYQLEVASVLDSIIETMPKFIESDKYLIVKEFHDKIKKNPILIENILNKYPDVRGTTCQKSANNKFILATKGIDYEYVIVDEAARANPLDLIIPLVKGKKVILVGDHKQLPHMIETHVENMFKDNEEIDYTLFEEYIKQSLFGRLFNKLPESRKAMLDTQYRMTEEIGDLVSELFYDSKLKTGTKIKNDTPLYTDNALVYIDVKGKQTRTNSGSLKNEVEADEIINKLKELDELNKGQDKKKISVGIISFYKAQVENLIPKIRSINLENIDVEVGTVDAYQGLEKDIIFLSTVRTQGIGFISNPNRLNVSLSRAKKLIVLFGDIRNLKSDKIFRKIIDKCKDGREL